MSLLRSWSNLLRAPLSFFVITVAALLSSNSLCSLPGVFSFVKYLFVAFRCNVQFHKLLVSSCSESAGGDAAWRNTCAPLCGQCHHRKPHTNTSGVDDCIFFRRRICNKRVPEEPTQAPCGPSVVSLFPCVVGTFFATCFFFQHSRSCVFKDLCCVLREVFHLFEIVVQFLV